ncbi:hypothetical protein [Robiginitalea aurantiaca]|uniref:Lipocalin-like domain-containing protein n=1 Tax=Robiginitalea aurantiaca TaxID=3056915 RepID=A0ABT7WDN4_9FLAO|nr:hypothetical protein [Robiginitalea aurantiaca]MDM9630924.1 hypothetical protein [Robiginitalea aurantiaca]
MKKFLILLISISLFGCSDDDGGSTTNPNRDLVVGTWNLSELTISPAQDINQDGSTTTNVLSEIDCTITGRITINQNNTWTFSGNDLIVTTITGGLFIFQCSENSRNEGGNWDIEGNVLRLADGTGAITLFSFSSTQETLTNIIGENLPGLQAEIYSKQ